MARFAWNRQVPLILALIVSFALLPIHARPAHAWGREYGIDPAEPGVPPPPGGIGDPDEPIPGKSIYRGSQQRGATRLNSRTVGDGRDASGVGMWRLRVVLLGLRAYILRF